MQSRALKCPLCGTLAVIRKSGVSGSTHHCGACGGDLKVAVTARTFLAFPVAAVTLGLAYLLIPWINNSGLVAGSVRAALVGGIAGVCAAVPLFVARRGIELRAVPGTERAQ